MRATAAVLLALVLGLGACSTGGGERSPPRPPATTSRHRSVAGVALYRLPTPAVSGCRSAQRRARISILCPRRLPRPASDSAGASAVPPDPLAVSRLLDRDAHVIGLDFSYSAPTEDPRLDGPQRFLHLVVQEQDERLPPGARPATIGGRSGLYARPSGRDYSGESYFANHARFFWHEHGVRYAATLHDFGARTRRVLDALVAGLRPADEVRPPRRRAAGRRVTAIEVPVTGPVSVATGPGAVWVAGQGEVLGDGLRTASLARIDPVSRRVTGDPIEISRFLGASAVSVAGNGAVWVAHRDVHRHRALRRLDPDKGRFVQSVEAGPELVAVAAVPGALWAVDYGGWPGGRSYRGGTALRVEPGTGRIAARIRVGRAPAGVAAGEGGVWVTNNLDRSVSRIDPRTDRVVHTIRVGGGPVGVAAGYGAVWVANNRDGTVSRMDPATNGVAARIAVGQGPRGVAVASGSVWVTNELDDSVSRIDPTTDEVAETIPVGAGPAGIAGGEGAVWVADNLDQAVTRIDP